MIVYHCYHDLLADIEEKYPFLIELKDEHSVMPPIMWCCEEFKCSNAIKLRDCGHVLDTDSAWLAEVSAHGVGYFRFKDASAAVAFKMRWY